MTDAQVAELAADIERHLMGALEGSVTGDEIVFCCPFHHDENPSASWSTAKRCFICRSCDAKGGWKKLAEKLGLELPERRSHARPKKKAESTIVATYDYTNAAGDLLFQAVRFEPKDFRQRRPDRNGGWIYDLNGVERVIYRLQDLATAGQQMAVFSVEGEKDVDRLRAEGLLATCNPMGAGKWRDVQAEALRGRDVVILPDNDKAGREHGQTVAASVFEVAASVRVVELPGGLAPKGDVSDWLDAGNTVEDLMRLAEDTPPYEGPRPNGNGADAPPPGSEEEQAGAGSPELAMLPRRTRAEMATRRLRYVCPEARALPRGLITQISSFGGVGKTRLMVQLFGELDQGLAPFGEDTLKPEGRTRCLYVGAEDSEPLFNEIALPLLPTDDSTLPFDVLLLEEQATGFTLDANRAQQLAAFAAEHGPYDVIGLDPLSALIPLEFADAVRNQFVARQWQRIAFGPLRTACPEAAIILSAHDTKSGGPVSGSADFINFGRCGLQLRAGGAEGVPDDVAEGSIEVLRFKDNVGFRFKRMILRRDPNTLLLAVEKTEAAYGAGARSARYSQADLEQYLATQAQRFLRPAQVLPDERTRTRVEATLMSHCTRDGVKVSGRNLGRFLDAYCTWRDERLGRSTVKILEDVRDPSAAEEARYGA